MVILIPMMLTEVNNDHEDVNDIKNSDDESDKDDQNQHKL